VHWEPGVVPDADAWRELDQLRQDHPAKLMVWEGEPAPEALGGLRQRGIDSVLFKPVANRDPEGDFLKLMAANVARLEAAADVIGRSD